MTKLFFGYRALAFSMRCVIMMANYEDVQSSVDCAWKLAA